MGGREDEFAPALADRKTYASLLHEAATHFPSAQGKTMLLFLYYVSSEAFKPNCKGQHQYTEYIQDNSLGKGDLNTTNAGLSCRAKWIFGTQTNQFTQNPEKSVFLQKEPRCWSSKKEEHAVKPQAQQSPL